MNKTSRGLLAGFSPEELRQRRATAPHAELWNIIRNWTREIIERDKASEAYSGISGLGWHSVTPGAAAAAALWRVEGDREALDHVERCIGYLAEVYEGSAEFVASLPDYNRHPVLSHGEIAMAADMCRADLKPQAVETLCRITRREIIPDAIFRDSLVGYSGGSNITATRNIQAGIAALLWGAEAGYEGWQGVVDRLCDVCRQYLRHGLDAQGLGFEAAGYTQAMTGQIALAVHLLKQSGYANLYAGEPLLHKAAAAHLHQVFPDRSGVVNTGDVGIREQPEPGELLWTARAYGDPVLQGLFMELVDPEALGRRTEFPANLGAAFYRLRDLLNIFLYWEPNAPWKPLEKADVPTAFYSPGTEFTAFRTSWSRDAVFVNFLGSGRSHTALTHAHQDSGHVSLFAYGDYLAIDTGRYNGGADQHSVMLVEGEDDPSVIRTGWGTDFKAGRITDFQRHQLLDYARADSALQRQCIWADRHLLFIRLGGDDCYVVAIDNVNKDNGKHRFVWQMQAHPESKVQLNGGQAAVILGPRARLDITFAIPAAGHFPGDRHTLELKVDEKWWSWPYGKDQDTSQFGNSIASTSVRRPRLSGILTGLNGLMAAVLSPRRNGQDPLPVQTGWENGVITINLKAGPICDTILVALDHGYIDITGYRGLTELALIRRIAGGAPTYWTANGAQMTFD